ncbi:MAG: glycogen-binding domain-containing protein [Elusimicrobia bacterium]|nr:glycogen-binding domain-containing protein [Elusimicrobiota bacterium]MDE2511993.1 glycogen-binding domain-containing protein [Elusimicrobiota bacterium]
MNWRNPWTFWGVVVVVLGLISVPSIEWIEAARDYARFASGWEPSPLKPTVTTFTPREGLPSPPEPELKPFEFKHKAPRAKSVELVGDFNAWKPGLLKMKKSGGLWIVTVPLRPGPHKYLFLDDGRPVVDPSTGTADGPDGRRVSLRTVK